MITAVIKDSIESERFFSVHGRKAVEMLSKLHDNYWCGDGLLYVLSPITSQ